MAKSYYSKKLDRVISARHNIDKWEVDRNAQDAPMPVPMGYSGMHGFAESRNEQYVQLKQEEREIKPQSESAGIFGKFTPEDILLAAMILILLSDENKNTELIVALAFLFIAGFEW